jgi:hypothetical protein
MQFLKSMMLGAVALGILMLLLCLLIVLVAMFPAIFVVAILLLGCYMVGSSIAEELR